MFQRPWPARSGSVRAAMFVILCLAATLVPLLATTASGSARFHVECPFVRHRRADPIVHPGHPGTGHLHAFFGNRSTDAHSTYRSLRRAGTTCGLRADKSAYWIPAMYERGHLRRASDVDFYYRGETEPLGAIRAFPKGLKIIAGNMHATRPQSTDVVAWSCHGGGSETFRNHPYDCGSGRVKVLVRFPECWDGRRTDSRNHRAHMHYRIDGAGGKNICPRSHPVPVPKLVASVTFPIHDGTGIDLATGAYRTMHADFINAWDQRVLRRLVRRCIHAGIECTSFEA